MLGANPVVVAAVIVLGSVGQAAGALLTIGDSGRGWITSLHGSNGNDPGSNYFAGRYNGGLYRNHFDFQIPVLDGTLESAILQLDNPYHSSTSTRVYTIYSLGAYGTYGFDDIGTGTQLGRVSISNASGLVAISLNDAALRAIKAAQGGIFSLGGVDSGERAYRNAFDFGWANSDYHTTLTLNVESSVPEPSTIVMFTGLGTMGLIAAWRRRRRNAA